MTKSFPLLATATVDGKHEPILFDAIAFAFSSSAIAVMLKSDALAIMKRLPFAARRKDVDAIRLMVTRSPIGAPSPSRSCPYIACVASFTGQATRNRLPFHAICGPY